MTLSASSAFTAGACRYAADAFRASQSAAQRAFAPTLDAWASNAVRRGEALPDQPDLFGLAA